MGTENVPGGDAASAPQVDFSDVASGTSSAEQTYTVVSGDNLSKIAKHFYGDANEWKRIFDANGDQLSDPDRIRPGQVLKIPPKP